MPSAGDAAAANEGTGVGSLDIAGVSAAPGIEWCREWTRRVDEGLIGWLQELRAPDGVAVVALGSYARAELCPASDIDLLLLHDGWDKPDLEALVQGLCYPLWDAGLSVGHAVRTPKDAVRAAGERIDTATALTDRRLVAGDSGLLDELASRYRGWTRRRAGALVEELARADAERHLHAGSHPGMQEPDLKEGAGGLRDLASLRWAAGCLLGDAGLDPLVGARYLGASDHGDLVRASHVLLAARCALHLVRGGGHAPGTAVDRLRLDIQDEVAQRLGLGPRSGGELLRQVGLAGRTVAHVHRRAWPRLLADARGGRRRRVSETEFLDSGIMLDDGAVEIAPGRTLASDPSLGLRAVAAAAHCGVHIGRATAARLRREIEARRTIPWDERSRAAFLAALRQGRKALPAFSDADQMGLVVAHLPDWADVRGRPQRNPFHRYDLDTHLFQTVAELVDIIDGAVDGRHSRIFETLNEPEVLLLAALFHDIGKAFPGDHSVAGAPVARDWILRMGFGHRRADRVARLVRLHLLLPDTATRRDLDDHDEIAAVADSVGDVETLDALYLLSIADARATGPAAFSPWKEGLIAELHARVRRVLTGSAAELHSITAPETVVADARRLLDQADGVGVDLDALLVGVPRRYLLAASAEQVVAHAGICVPAPGPGELRASFRAGPAEGTLTLTIVAADRRGLMADCAGVLAGHGLVVLEARAFTRGDGVALDWFVVRPRLTAIPAGIAYEAVLGDLQAAAAMRLDVEDLVARREARRDERPRALAVPLDTEVSFDRGPVVTRIEVRCPDAPGVLFRLARVLAAANLDVVGARVATLGPEVRDVFFVRPAGGPPDTDALAARLREQAGWPEDV